MPTLKETKASSSYVQCFLYLVSSSINVFIFYIIWLDTFWKDHIYIAAFLATCLLMATWVVSILGYCK